MKHKLLPTLIGAALAAGMGAAQADITVFGHIDTSIVNMDQDHGWRNMGSNPRGGWYSSGASTDTDDTNFVCTTCSIGFKGSEDLGNGLKAIFYMDFQMDMFSRDSTSLTDRDQWLGLAGNFGQVRWGTISTPYKSHGSMLDPLYRTSVQGRAVGLQSYLHNGATEEGGARSEYTVRWDSPSWNGLKVAAFYTLDSDEDDGNVYSGNVNGTEDDNPYGIGAQYKNGGILVFADYLSNDSDDASNPFGDTSAWKVGGKYTLNNFAVMGQYESLEQNIASFIGGAPCPGSAVGCAATLLNDQEGTWWHVAGSYTMGNNMVYLGYGQSSFDDLANGNLPVAQDSLDADALTIAGTHNLSKRTKIYAAYSMQSQDADNTVNDSKNCVPATGAGCQDVDKDVFAIGMKHKF